MATLSLLLIEDDLVHADMLRRMMLGLFPLQQVDRIDHIQALSDLPDMRNAQYDAILLDLNLPDSHGLETLARVRAAFLETPVVVLTSTGADEIGMQAIEAGAQDFLEKNTVDRKILHRTVGYAVERHHQTRALQQAQLMQATVLRATSSAIIALDDQGQMLSVNEAAIALLGLGMRALPCPWPQDVSFRNSENFGHLKDNDSPLTLALSGAVVSGRLYALSRDGLSDIRFVRVSATALNPDDFPMEARVALVLSIDDVTTEYRSRQELERAGRLDALGQLSGGIAHDFNNILGTILPSLQLACHQSSEPEIRDILEPALSATKRGASLVGQLLSFTSSAPETARQVDLAICLQGLKTLASKTTNLPVLIELESSELEVCCDGDQLENALLNLMLNARDAIQHTGIGDTIILGARILPQTADMPAMVEICVSDNGPGMEAAIKARAVDPFFSTKSPNHGSGLGLSMVYGFVKAAGGALDIASQPNAGTKVRMALPASGGMPRHPLWDANQDENWAVGHGQGILLVEDEADLRLITATTLTALGFDVSVAATAEEALEILATYNREIDVLFTDIVLSGKMNGYGLARVARKQIPNLRLIYTSGYTGVSEGHAPPVPGPFLSKPCDIQDLVDTLQEVLSKDISHVRQLKGAS